MKIHRDFVLQELFGLHTAFTCRPLNLLKSNIPENKKIHLPKDKWIFR